MKVDGTNNKDFSAELRRVWNHLPDKFILLPLLLAWLLLFQFYGHCSFNYAKTPSLFEWMYTAYNTEALDSAHGQLIPFIILIILWTRRHALRSALRTVWWPALFLLAFALIVHFIGFFAQQPRLSIIAFYLGIYALCGLTWGFQFLRATFFPFILFLFAIPLGTFVEPATLKLRLLATQATTIVTRDLLDIKITTVGTTMLDAHGTPFEVAAACSGIRSFFALLLLTVIYAMIGFKSIWRRALIVLFTVPLAVVCNILRLTAVIVSAQAYGATFAYHVHDWFWIITYSLSILLLFIVLRLMREKPEKIAA